MEYYSSSKEIFVATWIELKGFVLNKTSQIQNKDSLLHVETKIS